MTMMMMLVLTRLMQARSVHDGRQRRSRICGAGDQRCTGAAEAAAAAASPLCPSAQAKTQPSPRTSLITPPTPQQHRLSPATLSHPHLLFYSLLHATAASTAVEALSADGRPFKLLAALVKRIHVAAATRHRSLLLLVMRPRSH